VGCSHCTVSISEAVCWVEPEVAVTLTVQLPEGVLPEPGLAPPPPQATLEHQSSKQRTTDCEGKKPAPPLAPSLQSDSQRQAKDRKKYRVNGRDFPVKFELNQKSSQAL
jgi:hypothetical protein